MPYEKTVVSKPWGYEYLAYQNDKVALWFLYIGHNHQTSMHCHPNKTTGLILLDGEAQISFLWDKFDLKPVSKTMIRKGLFTIVFSYGIVYLNNLCHPLSHPFVVWATD